MYKSFRQWIIQENFLEGIKNYRPFVNTIMKERGQNETSWLVFADFLEEHGDTNLSQAIHALFTHYTTNRHDQHMHLTRHVRPSMFSRDHTETRYEHSFLSKTPQESGRDFSYASSSVNLNNNANPMSRSQRERNRYWNIPLPAGHSIYRFSIAPWHIQELTRPKRRAPDSPNRTVYTFSSALQDANRFTGADFKEVNFTSLPDNVASYFFFILLNHMFWERAAEPEF
jgi:uncharacterized protein (TIGR02996 family)